MLRFNRHLCSQAKDNLNPLSLAGRCCESIPACTAPGGLSHSCNESQGVAPRRPLSSEAIEDAFPLHGTLAVCHVMEQHVADLWHMLHVLSPAGAWHAGQATSVSDKPLAEHAPPKARFSRSGVGRGAEGNSKGRWRSQVHED